MLMFFIAIQHSSRYCWTCTIDLRSIYDFFLFTSPSSRQEGKRYTHSIMSELCKDACKRVGENISLYAGLKHSSCCQDINERGLSLSDLQAITDHARLDSVKRYAKTELARKRELMEGEVTQLVEQRGRSGVES